MLIPVIYSLRPVSMLSNVVQRKTNPKNLHVLYSITLQLQEVLLLYERCTRN